MRVIYFGLGLFASSPAMAGAVENAFALCRSIDATGLSSAPCEVSGWQGTITATLDMSTTEAQKTCTGMVGHVRAQGIRFEGRQWVLQIVSPYSNGNTVAYCNLPQ